MESKLFKIAVLVFAFTFTSYTSTVVAQLPNDLRDVFEGMLDDLDEDIRACFQKAIDNNTSQVEFTADQFRRFRSDPINPFEGIEGVDPDDVEGNVILKFELPSIRNRTKNSFERQHASQLRQLNPVVRKTGQSTVAIRSNGRQLALEVVVSSNGLILTKASELRDKKSITCDFGSGFSLPAKIVRTNKQNDLALLQVAARDLTPVSWSSEQPLLGSFLLTSDENGRVVFMGSYSVTPRSTSVGERALLGVKPETTPGGVRVSEITSDTAAAKAGLENGDVITKFDGVVMRDMTDLVNQVRKHRPGDRVRIDYLRGSSSGVAFANLAAARISGERAAEFKMMNRLGAIPSQRSDSFPFVFQHDTPLFPEQCGGPVVDLKGNVVGINIARNGRAATYAIPTSHVKTILAELMRNDVAEKTLN